MSILVSVSVLCLARAGRRQVQRCSLPLPARARPHHLQTFCLHFDMVLRILEKEVATHSRIEVCEIPRTEEPDGLQSTGSHIVGRD